MRWLDIYKHLSCIVEISFLGGAWHFFLFKHLYKLRDSSVHSLVFRPGFAGPIQRP